MFTFNRTLSLLLLAVGRVQTYLWFTQNYLHVLGLFHFEMAPFVWRRNVVVHCFSKNTHMQAYNRQINCLPKDAYRLQPLHFTWLPSNITSQSLTHIIPIRPARCGSFKIPTDLCGATVIGRCHSNENTGASLVKWVECSGCLQWYHCECVGVDCSSIKESDEWFCGCRHQESNCNILKYVLTYNISARPL